MTVVSQNVYINKLYDIVQKYSSTYHITIKIKLVMLSTYTDFNKENNDKDSEFKIGYIVRMSKYKNIFAKGCPPNWSEEVFVIKGVNDQRSNNR